MKGSMFGGKQSSALSAYTKMSAEQKLLATKEMGTFSLHTRHQVSPPFLTISLEFQAWCLST